MFKCPHARGRSWGPGAPASDPRAIPVDPVGAPWPPLGSIFSIFGRPEADQKINDFSTPSKIAPRGQKVEPRAPQGRFFMDFDDFLGSFFHVFLTFSRNIAKVKIIVFPKEKQGFSRFRPLKINHFSVIFRSIFHAFSGTALGATFLKFYVDF